MTSPTRASSSPAEGDLDSRTGHADKRFVGNGTGNELPTSTKEGPYHPNSPFPDGGARAWLIVFGLWGRQLVGGKLFE
ncbi:hypothetical protein AAF712_008758 [Marasmius tenuissimus]|uniref:Uncharacterized protein n=1 Tax=Marasmius tenuissimus TaxID=585030 RepID=A0ABR2ZT98_9AGAR